MPRPTTITPLPVAELLVDGGERWPVCAHVIDHPDARVLVDTGGLFPLTEQAFDAAGIDVVVNTHLHFDHCGGNHLFAGRPISVQRQELEDARGVDYTIREWVDAPGVSYEAVDGETGGRPVVVGGDVAVRFAELDEPSTEGQLRVRALDPELVWLAHEREPWRPPMGDTRRRVRRRVRPVPMFGDVLRGAGTVREYYARRAAEYDATSWDVLDAAEREAVERFVTALAPGRVLDIGCGTGYLTRLLRGSVVAVDQSDQMLAIARKRAPHVQFVRADVPPLPFADDAFDLSFSSGFYSHLETVRERAAFVAEALRVAPALIVLDQARRDGRAPESWELRRLRDGSEYRVFKRYFTAEDLTTELDGVGVFASTELLAVRTSRTEAPRA